jgi:hypothetical protein
VTSLEQADAVDDDSPSPSIINPAKAINELDWKPRHVGFVEEIDIYYKAWAAHK